MAHYERYKLHPSDDSDVVAVGVRSFLEFFRPDTFDSPKYDSVKEGYEGAISSCAWRFGKHKKTVLHTVAGDLLRQGEYVGTCLLDYVYCWLVNGMAGRDCTSYQVYLLTVIAIIERYYTVVADDDELRCLYDAHGGDFPIYNFLEEGRDHPTLRRDVFEFYQRRVLAEEPVRRLQGIYETAVSES